MLRAKNFEEIKIGDTILFQMMDDRIFRLEVSNVNNEERCINDSNSIYDYYPNDDDQFIVIV